MKDIQILGLLLFIVILIMCLVKVFQEGFVTNQEMHDRHSKLYQKKYNNVGATLIAAKNEAALGSSTRDILGSIQDTMDSNNTITQNINDPYPVEGGVSGMSLVITKCEAVKTTDCNIFDTATFSKDCGICLDIGTNSEGKPQTGGLVLTTQDKNYAKGQQKGNFLPPYVPTVGSCPSGKMVATKAECIRLQNELTCQKGGTFNTPAGCSQCFSDGVYHVVDPSSQTDLIVGSGILTVVGSGTLEFTESGSSASTSNSVTLELISSPQSITLSGPEYTRITLKVNPYPVPTAYQDSKTYRVNDFIWFIKDNVKNVYQMQEGAGAPGYAPDRPGDRLWSLRGTWDNYPYKVATPAFIAGYLQTPNGDESQLMDLYRIIMTDSQTGRKPRTIGQVTMEGQSFTKMGTGYGKTFMNLTAYSPFSFIDPLSQEASLCPNSPYITSPESARLLNSDPCYAKGSGPGTYNLECLQQVFQNNGCGLSPATLDRSGFPSTNAKAATLMVDEYGATLKINEIADTVYRAAVATATGVDSSGRKLSITDWSAASVFCTGVPINSPCDTVDENGKLTDDCIFYLWDNQGENKIPAATYSLTSLARSLFSTGTINRFCTRNGTYAPKNSSNQPNATNLAYWKNRGNGSVAAVKAAMSQLHLDANSTVTTEDVKANFIRQCYGIIPGNRPNYSTSFQSDTTVQSFPAPPPSLNPVPSVSGLVAWFDAADPFNTEGTLSNGVNVKTWANKFGGQYNAVSFGDSNPLITNSLNNLPGIRISPGNWFKSPIPPGTFTQALNVFVVYKTTGSNTEAGQIITRGLSSVPYLSNPLDMEHSTGQPYAVNEMYVGPNNAVFFQSGNRYNFNNPTPSVFNLSVNQSSQASTNVTMHSNGSPITLNLSRGGSSTWQPSDLGDNLCIGGRLDNGAGGVNGIFYEVLVYNATLSDGDRRKIEGYLATKWALQSSLIGGHPYKTTPFTPMPSRANDTPGITATSSSGPRTGAGWSL